MVRTGWRHHAAAVPEGAVMTVTADRGAAGRSGARASGRGPARAAPAEPLSRADRAARGKDARAVAPLEAHAEFRPGGSRDPVGLLLAQAASRVLELVPVRHGRMLVSEFTFYRGAALPMAADLASTPASGLRVQLCGDAHLSNFGAFASPERRLVFDVNDFDETLPGPFEWDVKRLAASLAVAGRTTGTPSKPAARSPSRQPKVTAPRCTASPSSPSWTCGTPTWTSSGPWRVQVANEGEGFQGRPSAAGQGAHPRQHAGAAQAHHHGRRAAEDHQRPPDDRPGRRNLRRRAGRRDLRAAARRAGQYRRTLQSDRRHLVKQFKLVQMARKVVGVGSVGTRAWVLLMDGAYGVEPLFLQAKEAQPSVLARYAGAASTPTKASASSPGST